MGILFCVSFVMTLAGGPCVSDTVPAMASVRFCSPAGVAHGSIRRAVRRLPVPPQTRLVRSSPSQLSMQPKFGGASKAMLVCAGVVAGMYAGAHIGAATSDDGDGNGGVIGIPIGGALGGLMVWRLVR